MKRVTVYKRKGILIFTSSSQTTAGVWIGNDTSFKIEENASVQEINTIIQQCFKSSVIGIPHPLQWNNILKPLLNIAGVKSWNTFVNNTKCVIIVEEKGIIKLIPTKNLGAKDGFEHINSKMIQLDEAKMNELGELVNDAINLCE